MSGGQCHWTRCDTNTCPLLDTCPCHKTKPKNKTGLQYYQQNLVNNIIFGKNSITSTHLNLFIIYYLIRAQLQKVYKFGLMYFI